MAVYVDRARLPWGRMLMSHMVADTLDELHAMAARLGLEREWFQEQSVLPHYDICQTKRASALKHGAIEITRRQLVEKIRAGRKAPLREPPAHAAE